MPRDLTLTREDVEQALDLAGLDPSDLMEDYSGRGMYGASCPGITVASHREVYAFMAALGFVQGSHRHPYDLIELAVQTQYDQLGQGIIAYWPRLTIEDPAPAPAVGPAAEAAEAARLLRVMQGEEEPEVRTFIVPVELHVQATSEEEATRKAVAAVDTDDITYTR